MALKPLASPTKGTYWVRKNNTDSAYDAWEHPELGEMHCVKIFDVEAKYERMGFRSDFVVYADAVKCFKKSGIAQRLKRDMFLQIFEPASEEFVEEDLPLMLLASYA